ncbi:MAG: PAS domain S-box protein [Pseudomonadota bacterium]
MNAGAPILPADSPLMLFLENCNLAVAMLDKDLRYIHVTRGWRELYQLGERELIGLRHADVVPVSASWLDQYRACLNGETIIVEEDQLSSLDGVPRYVRRNLRPWRDEDGNIAGVVIEKVPITDEKLSREAYENQSAFLQGVLESIEDGIVACNANGELTLFNAATRRFHGIDQEALPPSEWAEHYDLFEPDGETLMNMERVPLFRALQGERVQRQEMMILAKGQKPRRLLANATVLYDSSGEKLGAMASMHDVTEQKMVEEALRESEARYRRFFNQAPAMLQSYDSDGRLITASDRWLEVMGYARAEVIGTDVSSFLTPDSYKFAMEVVGPKVWAGESVSDVELLAVKRNGEKIDILMSALPELDSERNFLGLLAVVNDVTQRREAEARQQRAETERRQYQKELELILDNVPVKIFLKDDQNNIIRLNKAAADSIGMSVDEATGASVYELLPAVAKQYHEDDLAVIQSGEPRLGMIDRYQPLGSGQGWARTDMVPYIDKDTGEKFVFSSVHDISDQKNAELALRESENRYRDLYNDTPAMLQSFDKCGVLLSVSDYWLASMGYTREEVIGRNLLEFLTPESVELVESTVGPKLFASKAVFDTEGQFVKKSGEILDVLVYIVPQLNDKGEYESGLAVTTDITERKQTERNFLQAQKMESIGQMTGGLAHDFNNILGVVMGNLELIKRQLSADPKLEQRIDAALSAATRGAELNKRLLAFARRQHLAPVVIAPTPLLRDMTELLQSTVTEQIQVDVRVAQDLPKVKVDPSQLESAILNLSVNARDAIGQSGTITIEAKVEELDGSESDTLGVPNSGLYVVIAVSDDGSGIAPGDMPLVFEPFFTTKGVGQGSGLGLSMVYGFIKQSGGVVRVHSDIGAGTKVRMYLPVEPGEVETSSQSTPVSTDLGLVNGGLVNGDLVNGDFAKRQTILLVEDQTDVRDMAVALLEDLGYRVLPVASPADALGVIDSQGEVDLLFTDIVMPGALDGTALANEARAKKPSLPVLFTSGYAERAVFDEGDFNAADHLLAKPYRADQLADAVARALGQRS